MARPTPARVTRPADAAGAEAGGAVPRPRRTRRRPRTAATRTRATGTRTRFAMAPGTPGSPVRFPATIGHGPRPPPLPPPDLDHRRRPHAHRTLRRSAGAPSAPTTSPPSSSGRSSIGPGIDPAVVEDVVLGCANQAGEDNRNVARMAALLAGLPVEVAGQTVNRLCGSGLQAINTRGARDRGRRRGRVHRGRRRVDDAGAVRDAQGRGGVRPRRSGRWRTRRSAGGS